MCPSKFPCKVSLSQASKSMPPGHGGLKVLRNHEPILNPSLKTLLLHVGLPALLLQEVVDATYEDESLRQLNFSVQKS